jgi:hypothetical protein
VSTTRAAAAFMLMFNIVEKNKKPKRKVRWCMKELYRQRMQYGNRLMRDMTFELVEDTFVTVNSTFRIPQYLFRFIKLYES